jgi:cyclopropane-fatty-acyl-phospholipid synthase
MSGVVAQSSSQTGTAKERALADLLRKVVGDPPPLPFSVKFVSGYSVDYGTGRPAFELEVASTRGLRALLSLDELKVCEAYVDGDLDLKGDILKIASVRDHLNDQNFWVTLWRRLQPLLIGRQKAQQKWVQNHYDSENIQLYFLDRDYNTYTPGIYEDEAETLETASERKHAAAFEGLRLKPGDRILDIGFGWGSFLRYATRRGVHVTGITLSRHQLKYVQEELVEKEGLEAELIYENFFQYQPQEQFDAIVMLGVSEELADYEGITQRLSRWVKRGGRVYLDFMAAKQKFVFPAFISKYIYQGGTTRVYLPEFVEAVTKSPFELTAVYNDRHNYYLTTKKWVERFEQNRDEIRARYGERLYRMFRLYLAGATVGLNHPSHLATAYRVFLELPADTR